MMKAVKIFMILVVLSAVCRGSQTDVVHRAEMVVEAQPIENAARIGMDSSAAVTLAATPGIMVNSQGVPGGQSDLSIRGSSFSGAGISLSGLALRSPETEHFNAELPIDVAILSAPRVLSGFDQMLLTEGHLVGTADFDILPIDNKHRLTLGLSEDNGYWLNLLAQQSWLPAGGDMRTGIGAFGSHTEINAVDYKDNDLRSSRGGGQLQFLSDDNKLDFLAGYQHKKFGARGYYGVNPDWYADEEIDDLLLLGSWLKGDTDGEYFSTAFMRRELQDDYTLYWSYPGVYNNQHKSVVYAWTAGGRQYFGRYYSLDWRGSAEDERIVSASLGNHDRGRGSGQLIPGVTVGNWDIKGGVRYDIFEEGHNEMLPQGEVSVRLPDDLRVSLSHSQSMRQPSYVELNYKSPASLGNSGLENQKSATTELRLDGNPSERVDWHAATFYRRTFNMVDWIRETDESKLWTATDMGTVKVGGAEGGLTLRSQRGSRIDMGYTWLHKSSDADFYSSRYVFNYPEHFFLVSGLWQINPIYGIELTQTLQLQCDNPLRDSSDTGYNGRLAIYIVPKKYVQLSVMIDNLWDDDFEYFPGQATTSPRRVSVGMTLDW